MSADPPFKKGDIVQRFTGGPPLTVTDCQPNYQGTLWEVTVAFQRSGENVTQTFFADDLQIVN